MLIDSSCTFLSMDAAGWTAVGTFVLAIVTAGLWIAAQKQLREQRRSTALLHKPFLRVQDFKQEEVKVNGEWNSGMTYELNNVGTGTAWQVKVITVVTFNGKIIQRGHNYEQPFIASADHYRIEVPVENAIDKPSPLHIVNLKITITFTDLEKPNNAMLYSVDYDSDMGSYNVEVKI